MSAPHSPTPLQARIPNLLTALRLLLTILFVLLLSAFRVPLPDEPIALHQSPALLLTAAAIFIIAALTDALDGYLARRWNAVSVLGRVMDPFADKLLTLAAFILLASPSFSAGSVQISGFAPWMVILILARELLITSLRAVAESRGADFSATLSGKLKMIAQSVAIPLVLLAVAAMIAKPFKGSDELIHLTSLTAWTVTLITAWSAVPYITRALRVLRPASGAQAQ